MNPGTRERSKVNWAQDGNSAAGSNHSRMEDSPEGDRIYVSKNKNKKEDRL